VYLTGTSSDHLAWLIRFTLKHLNKILLNQFTLRFADAIYYINPFILDEHLHSVFELHIGYPNVAKKQGIKTK
jgi:hypothetical protein